MDEVAQPLGPPFRVLLLAVRGHVKRPLSDESLGIGRHVAEVVHNNKHLHNGPQRVEKGDLNGSGFGDVVTLFA